MRRKVLDLVAREMPDGIDEVAILDALENEEHDGMALIDLLFEMVRDELLSWHGPDDDSSIPLIYRITDLGEAERKRPAKESSHG